MPMPSETTADPAQYAKAVYELALESWQRDLQAVMKKLSTDPQLFASLSDENRSFADRQSQLDSVLPDGIEGRVRNFLYTLLKNGDIALLDRILLNLTRLSEKGPDVEIARVTTAVELTESEKQAFRERLIAKYGSNTDVDFEIDESIIGGVIVQVGDQIIDGSVLTKLDAFRERLGRA